MNMGSGPFDAGDPTRPRAILEKLTTLGIDFAPAAGLTNGTTNGTVKSFLQRIIGNVGQTAASAKQVQEGQEIVLNGLQERFDTDSKVNVDEEVARMIELQQTYQASARILSTVNQLLTELMNTARQ